ncbi:MAG: hypothetical protein ACYDAB_16970 [bacterium]
MDGPGVQVNVVTGGDAWTPWPVSWSAVWVGALAGVAAALVFGLIGIAIGANVMGTGGHIVRWHDVSLGTLVASVFGAFLAFVIGGWCAGKVSGLRRAEPAILHGAIAFVVAVPLLVLLVAVTGGSAFGGWYGGLAGPPAWQAAVQNAPVNPDAARIARNAALAAVTAILLGLVGSVVGAWMASGEPMVFALERHRLTEAGPARGIPAGRPVR